MQPEIFSFSSPISRWRSDSKTLRDLLRERDRAGIGQAAIIETGAGDDVADQVEIGGGEPRRVELLPDRMQVGLPHMRQHDVLRMGDAQFVEAVVTRQIGHQADLSAVASPGMPPTGFRLIVAMA